MTKGAFRWRPMQAADLPACIAIAAGLHPNFPEDADVLAERQRLYPAGTWVLEQNGAIFGYLIAHPWRSASVPALNSHLGALPADADSFYLHDLAILPAARGTGAAHRIVEQMADHARATGFATMGLVAVNGSAPFWRGQGFAVVDAPALRAKLDSYEAAARFMVRPLIQPDRP